jgi:excisionase family DNA binding protein
MTLRPGREDAPFAYTTALAARWLGVSPGTIRRWCDLGKLPYRLTPGGQRRFSLRDLETFVSDTGRTDG